MKPISEAAGHRPKVAIVGAGFGGLWAALTLAGQPVDVLLVDRNNYHTFLALLYQVAAAELEAEQIAYPVRGILRSLPNITFAMAEVQHIDFPRRILHTNGPDISYDFLILSIGSVTRFFDIPGAEKHSFTLKSLEEGIALRNHILSCFEGAGHAPRPEDRGRLLTFVIVGGGATGVEYAGALAELIHGPLTRDYPALEMSDARVVLIEAQDKLLPGMHQRLQSYALERLRSEGVQVLLGAPVQSVTNDRVILQNGSEVSTETTVWTAGVAGHPLAAEWGLPTTSGGRVRVLPTLQAPAFPEAYVIGDLCYLEDMHGRPLPQVAPVAIQQGQTAAGNILRQIDGAVPSSFEYQDKGSMATIGRNAAVVQINRWTFTGFLAWCLWLAVHLMRLVGFRNRVLVLINWAWDYFLFERAVRLILPSRPARWCTPAK